MTKVKSWTLGEPRSYSIFHITKCSSAPPAPTKLGKTARSRPPTTCTAALGWISKSRKLQAPGSKIQRSSKLQAPNRTTAVQELWSLELGVSLDTGAWDFS